MDLERKPYSVSECVASALSIVAVRATEKGLRLRQQIEPSVPGLLVGDVGRVRQVLVNLLSNAVKFTHHGEIRVRVSADPTERGSDVRFEVCDTGVGIPLALQQKVLEPFTQVDASSTRREGGTGLGLAICRGLTREMGGTFELESVVGQGSTFAFTIPSAESPLPLEEASTTSDEGPLDELATQHPLRILVGEDNRLNQRVIQMLLERLGYDPTLVGNGLEVLAALDQEPYDMIFLDVHMPELDGLETARQIKARFENPTRPWIVATTASTMPKEKATCREAGMDDFLSKPIQAETLRAALVRCARKRAKA
jgi:CheY-like chemotaxis protein/anti-sigma regulatory factor (Ser/Thr protein kinase)